MRPSTEKIPLKKNELLTIVSFFYRLCKLTAMIKYYFKNIFLNDIIIFFFLIFSTMILLRFKHFSYSNNQESVTVLFIVKIF